MSSPSAGKRRMDTDVIKLIEKKYEVTMLTGLNEFCVKFYGPKANLSNIFESFLPQLLTYPNPIDPLNGDAAAMYLHKPEEYKKKVSDYVKRYATEEALKEQEAAQADSSDSESSMSDFSEDEAQDMEL
ncbi:hypothetical protein OTU49_009725 [Cherax quadricarinatus]|uniref:UBC core domain-containing protein n=1 Tax=Cherax quadricarinatus TaxID=27406 RepID=A0AAW0WIM4_CHEQU